MAKLGRKTKYSEELIDNICLRIRNGADTTDAMVDSGISKSTAYRWLDPSDPQNPLTPEQIQEFQDKIEGAKASRTITLLNRLLMASQPTYLRGPDNELIKDKRGRPIIDKRGDWRSIAWYFEATEPDKYSKKSKIEHSGSVGLEAIADTLQKIYEQEDPSDSETNK